MKSRIYLTHVHFQFNQIHFEDLLQFYQKMKKVSKWSGYLSAEHLRCYMKFHCEVNGSQETLKINKQLNNIA